jgi:hypothetical protein
MLKGNKKSPTTPETKSSSPDPQEVSKSPVEVAKEWLWRTLRSTLAGRLLIWVFVVLAAVAWIEDQFKVSAKLWALFKTPTTYATTDEITCLNEWVLKLAGENSQTAAEQTRARFLDDYKRFGHVNYLGQPTWENDIHVVRDPIHHGEWLVVIDMYPGASTRECMESGKAEMLAVLRGKPADQRREWDNRIGRLLEPAEPLCYDFAEFERTNGRVLNTGSDVQYQRSLKSCAAKLSNPRGFSCTDGH